MKNQFPHGIGIGLRPCHYSYIETEYPDVSWFEVLSDNYLVDGGPSLYHLDKIRASYPITLHGVGMSLGSTDSLDWSYLKKLKSLIHRVEPLLVSDHLSWTSLHKQHFHELLPLPYTEDTVLHVASRIRQVQDYLEQSIMIENVSSYLCFKNSVLTEWQFLQAIAEEADCFILLDINNIYVSASNNQFNPFKYLNQLFTQRIAQFHLAGFEDKGTHLLDTHGTAINTCVWDLYKHALNKFGPIPTVIERDNNIPEFAILMKEAEQALFLMENYAITD